HRESAPANDALRTRPRDAPQGSSKSEKTFRRKNRARRPLPRRLNRSLPMAKTPPDQIVIRNLELSCRIGITDEEQATPQRLTVSLVMESNLAFSAMEDRIENTID